MVRQRALPVLFGLLCAAALLAPGTASAGSSVGGGEDGAPGYVARIDVVRTATSTWTCSGALVAPRLVVTAAHCLYSARPADWTVTVASEARKVVAAVPHPGTPPAQDLAVLVLDRPVAQVPLALDGEGPQAPATAPASGTPVVAAGYGALRSGGNMSPVARQGTEVIDSVADRSGVPSLLLTRPTPAAGAPAPGVCEFGDSGGPLVPAAGVPALLGVLSEGNTGAGLCWYTRLDRAAPTRAWLDATIARYTAVPTAPTAPVPAVTPALPVATPAVTTAPALPAAGPVPLFTGDAFGG